MSVSVKELAWVIRVHDVGEDAAQRSREYDNGRGSIGWRSTILQAAAILCEFDVARKASGIETEGQDGETRLGAKHESPTAERGDAQEQSLEPKD